jgi:hypothetical protein
VIEGLKEHRRQLAENIEIEEAVEELVGRVNRVTIRAAPHVTRVLLELEELREEIARLRLPKVEGLDAREGRFQLVEPDQRNATYRHVVPPDDTEFVRTACGVRPEGWRVRRTLTLEELPEVLARESTCSRCESSCRTHYLESAR